MVDLSIWNAFRPGLIGHTPRIRPAGHGAARTPPSLNDPRICRNPLLAFDEDVLQCCVQEGRNATTPKDRRKSMERHDDYNPRRSFWGTSDISLSYRLSTHTRSTVTIRSLPFWVNAMQNTMSLDTCIGCFESLVALRLEDPICLRATYSTDWMHVELKITGATITSSHGERRLQLRSTGESRTFTYDAPDLLYNPTAATNQAMADTVLAKCSSVV